MYTERERLIFGPYWNGQEEVYADPLRVRRRLNNRLGGDLNQALAEAHGPVPELADKAHERVLAAAVYAFDLVPFDPASGEGVLEEDVIAVLKAFLDWLQKKSPGPVNSPTSCPPTTSCPGPCPTEITSG